MKFSSLPDLSINKPVLATVMSLLIVFAGIISFSKLPVREYPDIDPPVVTVTTIYPGASSKVIESEITNPIEEELAAVDGIRTMVSTSRDQVSSVVVEFLLEKDIDVAAQDVRDKIARIRSRLPDNVDEPVISKADADSQPVMWVRVLSESRSMIDLSDFDYENIIIRESIRLKDIADIKIGAANDRSFVRFNGIQGFGLGIIRQAKANSIQISNDVSALINKLQAKLPKDIKLDIGYDSSEFIKISMEELYATIWQATLLVLFIIFVFLRNLRSTLIPALAIPISLIGVMFGIQLMGFTVNQMTLLGLIISIGIVVDDSIIVLENIYRYIEEGLSPKEAAKKGAEEITMAVIATTLVLIAIFLPVAFLNGITGRLLSEFAFSLCFATLISAFVALTMAPMLCSRVLKAHDPNHKKIGFYQFLINIFEKFITSIENLYASSLKSILKINKSFTTVIMLACLPLMIFLFLALPKDFIPDEDRGNFLVIFKAPTGSSLKVMDTQIRKVENLLKEIPEVKTVISVAAFGINAPGKVTEGVLIARLVDWKERAKSVFAVVGPLYPKFFALPEVFSIPITPKSGPDSGFGAQPIQLVLKSNDIDYLATISEEIVQKSFTLPSIMFARSNLAIDKPELEIEIDRDKALGLGVSMADISKSIELLFAGVDVTDFNQDGEKYDVVVKLPRDQKSEIRKLGEFAIRTDSGSLVQISNLIKVKETVGIDEISHYNRKKSVTIGASPKQGLTPTDALNELEKLAKDVIAASKNKPADIEIDYLGTSKETRDSSNALYFGFVIALVFAYLFLAGQFESFVSPLVIMLTVPLALVGGLLGIWAFQFFPFITKTLIGVLGDKFFWLQYVIPQFTNISINIYSQVGMIMLIGLSTKNGILLVEFMSQLMERGLSAQDAVIEAARLRLRPVLMTALATILGILPIALALGVGTQSRQSLGVVIVAGLFLSSFLTLYVIPCAFLIMKSKSLVPGQKA